MKGSKLKSKLHSTHLQRVDNVRLKFVVHVCQCDLIECVHPAPAKMQLPLYMSFAISCPLWGHSHGFMSPTSWMQQTRDARVCPILTSAAQAFCHCCPCFQYECLQSCLFICGRHCMHPKTIIRTCQTTSQCLQDANHTT